MLSTTDMKYYTDPLVKPDLKATQILVTHVKYDRNDQLVGQIVNVKSFIVENTRLWWVTDAGSYVSGPAAGSLTLPRYTVVLAKYGDMFVVGETVRRRSSTDPVRLLHNVRTSTAQAVPHGGYLPVTQWVAAASWAHELMPVSGDSEDVIKAKLAVAKRKWETRHAKLEIMTEGVVREWTADLKRLQDEGVMYTGTYGSHISGTAMIPVDKSEANLSEGSKATVDRIKKSKAATKGGKDTLYVGIPVEYFAPMESTLEQAKSPAPSTVVSYLQQETGTHSAIPGPMTAKPVLMATY
jgi:hypothetical protein